MIRDLDRLSARTFDVLVVGGGIYGLAIAYDAAGRGLSVALVERDDFGSGSSFNHLRTIHGGLRYLQTFDLRRARESAGERRTLARMVPHTLAPLPFALPLFSSLTRGKMAMRAGFVLDRLVAFDRNRGLPAAYRLPAGRVLQREEALRRFPVLDPRRLTGAAIWYDYAAIESDRLTFAFALGAVEEGATLANHTEATALTVAGGRVGGVSVVDRLTGRQFEVAARVTVNATGGNVDRLLKPVGLSAHVPLLTAMNLVTRREAEGAALGGRAESGRNLFLVPWRGRALFGTWESEGLTLADMPAVGEREISAFLAELNSVFPSLGLTFDDVTLVHRGIVPAVMGSNGRLKLEGHEQVRDHATDGVEGLLSVAGTKYTTARAVADRLTTRLLDKLRMPLIPCRTGVTPLPGGDLGDPDSAVASVERERGADLQRDTIRHLVGAYGSQCARVIASACQRSGWCRRLADHSPVIEAEIEWAVREEMALTLIDAVVRRTPLGALGHPGRMAAERAAAVMGAALRWTPEQTRSELAALDAFYAPVTRQASGAKAT